VHRVPRHHVAILAHHQHARRGLRGSRGPVPPLAPPRRRSVIIVWDLHRHHLATADGGRRWWNRWRSGRRSRNRHRSRYLSLRLCNHGHAA
jgi:hypothetical protein